MKLVGIIRENEEVQRKSVYNIGRSFEESITNGKELENIEGIISYLKQGAFVKGLLLGFTDIKGNMISGLGHLTDGVWIWPSYLELYISLYKRFDLPEEFLEHLKMNNYKPPIVSEEQVEEAQLYYISVYEPERYEQVKNKMNKSKK